MESVEQVGGGKTAFLWFSGKGGTGKTTLSAATALQLARRGHEVLLVSTDPAHSLSDSLDTQLSGEPTRVVDHLDAVEVDPEAEADAYRAKLEAGHGDSEVMQEVYDSIDILGEGPGVSEMAAFNKFMEFMHDDRYDVVVFDTAPTGHTLKLLQLPEVMDSMVGKVLRMRLKFSQAVDTVKSLFGKGKEVEGGVAQLEEMKKRIEAARKEMRDPSVTAFNFVTIPEQMAVNETARAVEQVEEFGIPVAKIFVNQVLPPDNDCAFCGARRDMQESHLVEIHNTFQDHPIVVVPLLEQEVHGIDLLDRLSEEMQRSQRAQHEQAE